MEPPQEPEENGPGRPVRLPLDGVLDLHCLAPKQVPEIVRDYLHECRRHGITQVRIIHGKGRGVLRERVHAVLRGMPVVAGFRSGGEGGGGWGATVVTIWPEPPEHTA
ncbi:MAG: Smr/MutS family protein [Spirochaetota bacterium]